MSSAEGWLPEGWLPASERSAPPELAPELPLNVSGLEPTLSHWLPAVSLASRLFLNSSSLTPSPDESEVDESVEDVPSSACFSASAIRSPVSLFASCIPIGSLFAI